MIPAQAKHVYQIRSERAEKIQGYSRMNTLGPKAGAEGEASGKWSVDPNELPVSFRGEV